MPPKIKTVQVFYGRKFNLGDFNSAQLECSLWADLTEGEDIDQTMKSLWSMAKENVKAQIITIINKGANANTQELFLGLPVHDQPKPNQTISNISEGEF